MLVEEPDFMPYSPAERTVEVVRRIHEGKTPPILTLKALESLGVSSGNSSRVQKSLRFLALISPEFQLTDAATRIRKATSDEYTPLLGEMLRDTYAPIFQSYDPATATDLDLNNAFKRYDPAGQRANMIGLFMALCREAGLAPVSPETRRRGRPSAARAAASNARRGESGDKPPDKPLVTPPIVVQPLNGEAFIDKLLAKYPEFNPEWTAEVQAKWFEGFAKLQDHLKK